MIVRTTILPPGASAFTAWPFVFISPAAVGDECIVAHELVHLAQQRRWAIYGLGVGLLVWFFLYLCCLPFFWNHWRRKWETEAYKKGQGYDDKTIVEILKQPPYYLA